MDNNKSNHQNTPKEQSVAGPKDIPIIGITCGDTNGIGPEIILKCLNERSLTRLAKIIVYGSPDVFNKYRKILKFEEVQFHYLNPEQDPNPKRPNLIKVWEEEIPVEPGKASKESGNAALLALQKATADLKAKKIHALVTAPINKANMDAEKFPFPGHTEYLAHELGEEDPLMLMVNESLKVALATVHIPIQEVPKQLTKERLEKTLSKLQKTLKADFGISKPKIAVLGLNPHAGEEGKMGKEEQEIIIPLIEEWKNKGHLIQGPFPADGFFGASLYRKFDAVLAMYHDQGLTPFKALSFDEGVNFTAGLSLIRTSPDHGTAFAIAGKGQASHTSMMQSIFLAIDLAKKKYFNN